MLPSNFLAVSGGDRRMDCLQSAHLRAPNSMDPLSKVICGLQNSWQRKAAVLNVVEFVIVLSAVKARDLCMYRFYNWQEKVQVCVCTQEGDKMCCEAAPGYMSLLGHRDIWLQIYCRGLDGVLILPLRFYPNCYRQLLQCKGLILLGYCCMCRNK